MKNILSFFRNFYFLYFLNGILFVSIIYFASESEYEAELFNAMATRILSDSSAKNNSDSFFTHAMNMSNYLVTNRQIIFGNQQINGLKANLFHSSTVDLMTGNGACGSASVVLARILKAYNYQVRIAQMKVGDTWSGHVVTEVKKGNGWIVMDPLFNIYFKKPNGQFASFKDVKNNWAYYKNQTPANYHSEYNYADVRYTNWDKIKYIGPVMEKLLVLILGKERADVICLRSYLLRNYYLLFWASLLLWIVCTGWIAWLKIRRG
jgi:hypothetical protein